MSTEANKARGRSPQPRSRTTPPSILKIAQQIEKIAQERAVFLFEDAICSQATRLLGPFGMPKTQEREK